MISIQSPFTKEIPECKIVMRKLRKKIYKYTCSHKPTKKPKDSINDILTLLKPRKLPDFLLDSIKKRRNFDLSSIKNVVVPLEADFNEMKSLASSQETQIQQLFQENKTRLRNYERKAFSKFQKKQTNCSSYEESDLEIFEESESLEKKSKTAQGVPSITHDSEDHHFRDDYGILSDQGFLAFERDLYSEEEWLKF